MNFYEIKTNSHREQTWGSQGGRQVEGGQSMSLEFADANHCM